MKKTRSKKSRDTVPLSKFISILQGTDDKLGQFLDQDIEATANHRNVLRHFLDSCPSLVSPNVHKNHQYLQKYVGRIQNHSQPQYLYKHHRC
jgi:hypothetical protein